MPEVVIVEAVRTPVGRRNGGLSSMHSIDLLGAVQREVLDRAGVDPLEVGQVVGGCVGQVGMQAINVTRNAWLTAGLPIEVAATTVDAQCGSSQQATNLAYPLVGVGRGRQSRVACGVEVMSRVPMGATVPEGPDVGKPVNEELLRSTTSSRRSSRAPSASPTSGASPAPTPTRSAWIPGPRRGAWAEDRFGTQILEIDAPDLDDDGKPTGTTHHVARDEGLRDTTPRGARAASSRSARPTACTPPARRRRSPTAPARCCS